MCAYLYLLVRLFTHRAKGQRHTYKFSKKKTNKKLNKQEKKYSLIALNIAAIAF